MCALINDYCGDQKHKARLLKQISNQISQNTSYDNNK